MRRHGQSMYVPDAIVPPKEINNNKGAHALRSIRLECDHILKYKVNPPSVEEQVWCFKCDEFKERVA